MRRLIAAAAEAIIAGDAESGALVTSIAALPLGRATLSAVVDDMWALAPANGWDDDLGRPALRRRGAAHTRWLFDGERDDVRTGLEVLAWIVTLPPLPVPVQSPADEAEERMLRRVRALLAKAEATDSVPEAEALTAKAQELISRHALHSALDAGVGIDVPTVRHVPLEDPYADAKALLLQHIAQTNRCRSVQLTGLGLSSVFGFASDLHAVETLFTSLLVQGTRAMTSAGISTDRRTPRYRRAFLVAYAVRVAERLDTTEREAVGAIAETDDRLLPVLAARRSAVDDAAESAFGAVTSTSVNAYDRRGLTEGRAAADLAVFDAFDAVETR